MTSLTPPGLTPDPAETPLTTFLPTALPPATPPATPPDTSVMAGRVVTTSPPPTDPPGIPTPPPPPPPPPPLRLVGSALPDGVIESEHKDKAEAEIDRKRMVEIDRKRSGSVDDDGIGDDDEDTTRPVAVTDLSGMVDAKLREYATKPEKFQEDVEEARKKAVSSKKWWSWGLVITAVVVVLVVTILFLAGILPWKNNFQYLIIGVTGLIVIMLGGGFFEKRSENNKAIERLEKLQKSTLQDKEPFLKFIKARINDYHWEAELQPRRIKPTKFLWCGPTITTVEKKEAALKEKKEALIKKMLFSSDMLQYYDQASKFAKSYGEFFADNSELISLLTPTEEDLKLSPEERYQQEQEIFSKWKNALRADEATNPERVKKVKEQLGFSGAIYELTASHIRDRWALLRHDEVELFKKYDMTTSRPGEGEYERSILTYFRDEHRLSHLTKQHEEEKARAERVKQAQEAADVKLKVAEEKAKAAEDALKKYKEEAEAKAKGT